MTRRGELAVIVVFGLLVGCQVVLGLPDDAVLRDDADDDGSGGGVDAAVVDASVEMPDARLEIDAAPLAHDPL